MNSFIIDIYIRMAMDGDVDDYNIPALNHFHFARYNDVPDSPPGYVDPWMLMLMLMILASSVWERSWTFY